MTRFYLDTEFYEDGRTIDLISVALVTETGQEFYRQNAQVSFRSVSAWVQDNVLPKLWPCPKGIAGPKHVYGQCADPSCPWRPRRMIADELLLWVRQQSGGKPEFWAYYADYDWVALCQLYGTVLDLPKGWPMYCRDIKQWADYLGGVQLPEAGKGEHNALSDARWNREAWLYLKQHEQGIEDYRRYRYAGRQEPGAVDKESEGVRSLEKEVWGHPGGEDEGGPDQ